jgi:mono/diheme cytochrome c family protein
MKTARRTTTLALVALCASCGNASPRSSAPPQLAIVTASGAPLDAVAGDAIPLKVVLVAEDGSTQDLPDGASVAWTSPAPPMATVPPNSTAASPMPVFGAQPTAGWIDNPYRPDRNADLGNVLFILDPGTVQNAVVQVSATVAGVASAGNVTANVNVGPTPLGDWTRGSTLYGPGYANCAACHGATGHGTPLVPGATTYSYGGGSYDFPAPGINAEPGNAAGDPAWNAALFAVAARADMDNGGMTLRFPMPDWLDATDPATGQPLATQDFADIFAFLKTQTH